MVVLTPRGGSNVFQTYNKLGQFQIKGTMKKNTKGKVIIRENDM